MKFIKFNILVYIAVLVFNTNTKAITYNLRAPSPPNAIEDDEEAENFLKNLKIAVNKNDKEAVADIMDCTPCFWSPPQDKAQYIRRKEFIENYEKIMTPYLKQRINETTPDNLYHSPYDSYYAIRDLALWFTPHYALQIRSYPSPWKE